MTSLADLPDWPACLDVEAALAYSGLAASELARHAREGRLHFEAKGPNGRKICRREELDRLIALVFANDNHMPVEDMDFG